MVAVDRRRFGQLLIGASALALVACNAAGSGAASPDDIALGADDAPVTLIEYASAVCPHCAELHERVWDQLKTNYIDTGRVRFVYREYPTAPAPVAVAGFQLARCGGATPEQYFVRLGEFYRQQPAIFSSLQAGSMEGVRRKIIEIGEAAGLSEEQVLQCISDEAGPERIRRIVDAGNREFNVTGTPTLVINGRKIESTPQTYEELARLLDEAGA
jgi:protein-disulfide isomerase